MRRNLFLHFLNRDSREIYNLYGTQSLDDHTRLLRRTVNAAVILCEDHCIMPPGFVIEDDIAFGLAEAQREYLASEVLQFPLREGNLADYAEKKRIEYQPMRNRYSGLFSDNRIDFLSQNAPGLIRRKTHISEGILSGWSDGVDTDHKAWKQIRTLLPVSAVEAVRRIPRVLSDSGVALTWSAIAPRLQGEAQGAAALLRNALQYTYFSLYCAEFKLISLVEIPFMLEDFYLPRLPKVYNYRRLQRFLDVFGSAGVFFDAPASLLVRLRSGSGFIALIDVYAELAAKAGTLTDLTFAASEAAKVSGYAWHTVSKRFGAFGELPGDLEFLELDHAMDAAATCLSGEHGLRTRKETTAGTTADTKPIKIGGGAMADLVIFVALQGKRFLTAALHSDV
jgi:hypothetical protein